MNAYAHLLEQVQEAIAPFAQTADDLDIEGRVLTDGDGIYAHTAGDYRNARAAREQMDAAEYEVNYEVWQNDALQALSTDLADANHYAAVYGQDGPVEIIEAVTIRRNLSVPAQPTVEA